MENFPPMASERRPKWQFKNMDEVNRMANAILRYIVKNERSKRWGKVVEAYKRLLWVIDKKHFPSDYEPPSSYTVLIYELNFHLGLALQRLGLHGKSIQHYTQAIQTVSIPKGGCLAGCVTNSCMMTPIYSRRAFAFIKVGDKTSALRDAESAVVLDNRNPDVYCIRALVKSSRGEENQALADLDYAIRLCPSHVSSLVVRGAITRPLAGKISPESQSYFHVNSFDHHCILDFYDRLLFTLLVPHTITDINLTPDKPSKKQIDANPELYRTDSVRSMASSRLSVPLEKVEPFRCGTPYSPDNVLSARRRHDYGAAVRKHNSRPKTASQYMAVLEKERKLRKDASVRIQSALTRTGVPSSPGHSVRFADQTSDQKQTRSLCKSQSESSPDLSSVQSVSGRSTKTRSTKAFVFDTPSNYTIPVFQPMNIAEAPRMYYRPWRGDKLPLGSVLHPKPAPAFYV